MESMRKWMLLFLLIGILSSGFSKPSLANLDDDYAEDSDKYQNDAKDYNSQEYDEDTSEDKNSPTPQFIKATLTKNRVTKVTEVSNSVTLECRKYLSHHDQDRHLCLWYKESEFLGSIKATMPNNRYDIDNKDLVISDVQPEDAGTFYCNITPENLWLNFTLVVNEPAAIRIKDKNRDVMGNLISYSEGDRIEIECEATGHPRPTITLASDGSNLGRTHGIHVEDGKMVIERAEQKHSGIYQCLADNKIGKPAHGSVTIEIEHMPRITIDHDYINAEVNVTRDLKCRYVALPLGRAEWKRNEIRVLPKKGKYNITEIKHEKHHEIILTIHSITADDLGEYKCFVVNRKGADKKVVSLGMKPEAPHLSGLLIQQGHVQTNWTIHSLQPLKSVELFYKKEHEREFRTLKIFNGTEDVPSNGKWIIQHKLQLSSGEWMARVKASNTEGYSDFSTEVKMPVVPVESPPDVDDHEEVQQSSFAGTGGGASTVSSYTILSTFLAIILTVTSRRLIH